MLTTVQNGYIQIAYPNVIGPAQGRDAVAAGMDHEGNAVPAIPSAGNPALWYVGIRTESAVVAPEGVSVCSAAESAAVLGVWA